MAGNLNRPSEYGGSDTRKTMGIQPFPHEPDAPEQLRLMYAEDVDNAPEG